MAALATTRKEAFLLGVIPEAFLDLGEVERAGGLARRIVLHGLQELGRQRLDRNDHEHAIQEPVIIGVRIVLRLLERVAPQIEKQRYAKFGERLAPDTERLTAVLEEYGLPVIIAGGDDLTVVVHIPELMAW